MQQTKPSSKIYKAVRQTGYVSPCTSMHHVLVHHSLTWQSGQLITGQSNKCCSRFSVITFGGEGGTPEERRGGRIGGWGGVELVAPTFIATTGLAPTKPAPTTLPAGRLSSQGLNGHQPDHGGQFPRSCAMTHIPNQT